MLTDVIAAVATPPGRSALAVVRVAGTDAHQVAATVLDPFTATPARQARRSRVRNARGEVLDDVLYTAFTAPHSYTGTDLVEISTHGGTLVPGEVLGALVAAGARVARPGEFTRRAVINRKLDLLQAEAVGDLIDATAPAQRRAAVHQLERGLSTRIEGLRTRALELETLIAYEIDFPEEDDGPIPAARIEAATVALQADVDHLRRTAPEGERLRDGALVVVAGAPNAGKSSLFNALVGRERAIVTDVPGTTRDAVEAAITCDGFPVRLVDTAGLRETADRVERMGVEVSRRYLAAADVVLFCIAADADLDAAGAAFIDGQTCPVLRVRTKDDLGGGGEADVAFSARTGAGLADLRAALARRAFATLATGSEALDGLVTRERHRIGLERAAAELTAFGEARASGVEAVVAAVHLRGAVEALEDIIGGIDTEDILDRLFASFCVGK